MKIATFLTILLIGTFPLASHAAGIDGDLYFFGFALDQEGAAGSWAQVGPAGAWKATLAGTVLNGKLYTVESTGGLFATELQSGEWGEIGKPEFANTRFLFGSGEHLYSIETNGGLYRINPADGKWSQVGRAGDWGKTKVATVLGEHLYSIETTGGLFVTDLESGKWQQVGNENFGDTRFLVTVRKQLYSIDAAGSLHRVNPEDGVRTRVGPEGVWKSTVAATVVNGQLYTVEKEGGLYLTDVRQGTWKQIGNAEFGATHFMFSTRDQVYTIESTGNLYRVNVKAGPTLDSFNWCPQEIERVFREQGKPFYHQMHVQQILGAKATHTAMMEALASLRQKTSKKDLVVIYIGAHGETTPADGWGIWTVDGKKLWGYEIKPELAKLPCQAIVMIETCTSGGFGFAHKNDPPVPPNVTALLACQPNQSTDNPLDVAIAEALYGRADFNRDGVITVDELIRYIPLRYKETWPNPANQSPVIVKARGLSDSQTLTKASPELCAVAWQGELWSAVLEKQTAKQFHVHMLGWSSHPGEPYFLTDSVPRDAICLPSDGKPVLVKQKTQWLPARLVKENGPNDTVHLLGEKKKEENVAKDRVKFPFVQQ